VELLDAGFTLAEGDVAAYGALKYDDENWRKFDDPMPFLAAAERHLLAVRLGEFVNEDDSADYKRLLKEKKGVDANPVLYHAAQAGWNMRAAWWVITHKLNGEWTPPSEAGK
jgi:choline dehydrogenase-like flavoprotein